MYRSQYDHDVAMFSPQGRIHQIEYAMEAVKQGSATIGIKSKSYVVLAGFKRPNDDFSVHQNKMFQLDVHAGIAVSGITCDARVLCQYMRELCSEHQYLYSSPMPAHRLVIKVADRMHKPTMSYGERPYGVGLLLAAYDVKGPHLYQLCPSANYYDCIAMSIGARSQSARTYLEKHLERFSEASLDELVEHVLLSLYESLPNDITLNGKNCGLAIVGENMDFKICNESFVDDHIKRIVFPQKTQRTDSQLPPPPPTDIQA